MNGLGRAWGTGLAVAVALGAPALGHATAAKKARPDLKTTRVAAPAYSHPGGELRGDAKVKALRRRARASKLRFYLSPDRKRSKGDTLLGGSTRVPALKPRKRYATAGVATVPLTVTPGSYYLVGCADDLKRVRESNEKNNCKGSPSKIKITQNPVTTEALLAAAVSRHEISVERALEYRVFAAFGDSRIPKRYLGDFGGEGDDSVLQEVAQEWPKLSASTKNALRRFFAPPAARRAKSAAERSLTGDDPCDSSQLKGSDWHNLPAVGGKVRIWWRDDPWTPWNHQSAIFLSRQIRPVYDRFKKLMGREPLSDASSPCFHGPDGALDIYLIRWVDKAVALTVPAGQNKLTPFACTNTPGFIVFRTMGGAAHISGVAHELFHAFQMAFPYKGGDCKEYQSFDEGSASWAAHYGLHPNDPGAGGRDPRWMEDEGYVEESFAYQQYKGWYFDLYLEEMLGAAKIPAIYHAFANQKSLEAINSVIDGGFKKRWPEFTLKAWNQDPVSPSFRHWEKAGGWGNVHPKKNWLTGEELQPIELAIGGLSSRTLNLPANLEYLARKYMLMAVVDSNIRYLKFNNTLAGNPAAGVQAIVTFADGHQEIQDWTARSKVEFCFDDSSGTGDDVTDIVLMYSNSDWNGKKSLVPSEQPTLKIRKECETYQYKILKAQLITEAHGTPGPDMCQIYGGITTSEERKTSSQLTTQPNPPVSKLDVTTTNGVKHVSGQIDAKIKWVLKDRVDGCKFNANPPPVVLPCSFAAPELVVNPADVQFAVNYQTWTSVLTGYWSVPDPEIGVASGSYQTECSFPYIHFSPQPDDWKASEPMFKFTQTGEHTISFTGNKHYERDEYGGYKTKLDYQWSLFITFIRVDENGNPL
jgi:hypothetical protein